ncbi:MAG: hypothetical protein ACI4LO_06380 [Anaerovoracaceae bacterium]
MDRIRVMLVDLPHDVYGFTLKNCDEGDNFYTIYINARMSAEKQIETYDHEISHIGNNDFEKVFYVPTTEVEAEAHGIR